ncbi:MAG: glycosyltransferase family 4 protein [Candidatus Rokubacteria bacterium]|nr:glycosyltransferase family 4 protein [Candidatus Rokubacteria bacterium]
MAELSILMVADVSPLDPYGGASRVLREQSRGLRGRGHRVEVLCRSAGPLTPATADMDGVPVRHYDVNRAHPVAFFVSSILGARRAYARSLSERRWDAVLFSQPLSAVGLCRRLPSATPAVYVFFSPAAAEYRIRAAHADSFHPRLGVGVACALLRWAEAASLRRARRVIVLSDFSRRQLLGLHGPLAASIVKIPGGADLERFRPAADRATARGRLGLPAEGLLLFTVRNLEPRMGLDALIHAVAEVRKDLDVRLVIGGQGRLRASLESLVDTLGLGGVVSFAGLIPEADLASFYQAADCFVLPTRSLEGFGLVTVEALACGTPVLGTPVGATPEILAPLAPELLTDDASPEALARGIRRAAPLLGDAAFRARCRAHADRHYGWPLAVARLEELLLELVPPSEL